MTTPSILDTFLAAFRDHTSATCGLDDRIARLTAELDRVPESCPSARGYLVMEISRAEVDRDTARRSIALRSALILGCRTSKGECDIDKPPLYPIGPPTKAERAARGNAGTEPPADPPAPTATTEANDDSIPLWAQQAVPGLAPTTGADAFMAAISDDCTQEQARIVLRERDWPERDMDLLTPTALIEVARRNLRPEQVEINEDGGAGVAGGEVIP